MEEGRLARCDGRMLLKVDSAGDSRFEKILGNADAGELALFCRRINVDQWSQLNFTHLHHYGTSILIKLHL